MSAGRFIIRKGGNRSRSNQELVNSLRENVSEAKRDYYIPSATTNGVVNGNGKGYAHGPGTTTPPTPVDLWTEQEGDALFIPRVNWAAGGLREDQANGQYEITLKLFFLAGAPVSQRAQYVQEALALVSRELGVSTVDLLVASFPGVSFEGTCEWEADKLNAQQGNLDEELATWRILEDLHRAGVIKKLGVAEFGSDKLRAFVERAEVTPVVDQINLRDCCNVPPPLKDIAESKRIELNVHVDCTDILPPGTLRELLGPGPIGAGVLADNAAEVGSPGLRGEIVPQWVVRYMAFVKDRGVIENKGYFAGAELVQQV